MKSFIAQYAVQVTITVFSFVLPIRLAVRDGVFVSQRDVVPGVFSDVTF